MAGTESQEKAFNFFKRHYANRTTFTGPELEAVTGWQGQTLRTYLSKQFKPFIVDIGNGNYRITDSFLRFSDWQSFRQLTTQVRSVYNEYTSLKYDNVLCFEFFMPLTNEGNLGLTKI